MSFTDTKKLLIITWVVLAFLIGGGVGYLLGVNGIGQRVPFQNTMGVPPGMSGGNVQPPPNQGGTQQPGGPNSGGQQMPPPGQQGANPANR